MGVFFFSHDLNRGSFGFGLQAFGFVQVDLYLSISDSSSLTPPKANMKTSQIPKINYKNTVPFQTEELKISQITKFN